MFGAQVEHGADIVLEAGQALAGQAVHEVDAQVAHAGGAQAGDGAGRIGGGTPPEADAQARLEALHAERHAQGAARRRDLARRPFGEAGVDVLGIDLDRDFRARREMRPEELEQTLEPVRPEQAGRAAAEVECVEAADVVRRPLPPPLGGDPVHEAAHLRGDPRPGRAVVADHLRGEVAVVALRPAEGHVHVDVPHRSQEGAPVHLRPPAPTRRRRARARP